MVQQDGPGGGTADGGDALAEYAAVFRSSPVGMALLDGDGRFLRANPALCRFLQREEAWLLGRTPRDVTLPGDEAVNRELARRLADRSPVRRVGKRYLRPDGTVVHGLVSAVQLDVAGAARTLAQIEDVTDRVHLEDELRRLATHDPLTGLPGRRLLVSRLEQELDGSGPGAVAVVFLDLDAFKLINDALGHTAGDAVLVAVAGRLQAAVREGDLVGRLAGDEFLVVAGGLQDEQAARDLVERLTSSLRRPVPFEGDEVFVSASVGLALQHPGAGSGDLAGRVQALLADADAAMYSAKRHGKRRYEVFDSAMRDRARARSRTAALLRAAVSEERLVVHYQPVLLMPEGLPVGVEALVRVQDPDGALLLPEDFLDVAEQIGVLPDLDAHVLRTATRQVQRWREDSGLDLHLSVNAGAGQVMRSLPEQLQAALAGSGLPADRLTLELTEQTFIDGLQAATSTLQQVKDSGVHLAIDDFGTGWASLTYLRRLPVDAIKVDRSFIAGLPASAQDGVVVGSLASLATRLGHSCVVEGVERPEQLAALLSLLPGTVWFAQGFLFGRPLSAQEALPALLRLAREAQAAAEPAVPAG